MLHRVPTYVKYMYDTKQINSKNSSIWEGLFIEITDSKSKKKITLANVYKPPKNNNNNANIQIFIDEFS